MKWSKDSLIDWINNVITYLYMVKGCVQRTCPLVIRPLHERFTSFHERSCLSTKRCLSIKGCQLIDHYKYNSNTPPWSISFLYASCNLCSIILDYRMEKLLQKPCGKIWGETKSYTDMPLKLLKTQWENRRKLYDIHRLLSHRKLIRENLEKEKNRQVWRSITWSVDHIRITSPKTQWEKYEEE